MSSPIQSGSFEITLIASTGDQFGDFTPYVASLNDMGTVAFQAALRESRTGVFSGAGTDSPLIDGAPDFPGTIRSHPDINKRGDLCFYADLATGGQGVFLARGGRCITIAETGARFGAVGPLGPTMNEAGGVAFRADFATGENGIFWGGWGDPITIATTRDQFSGFEGLPVINERGVVAFRADCRDGRKGIFIGDGGEPASVAMTGGAFADFAAFPSINDEGIVAFAATLAAGGVGVFTAAGGRITPVVDGGGPFESVRGALINNWGLIVFAATPRGGQLGIFAGPDPVQDRVLSLGDQLLESTVSGFALNPVSVNHAGQLAVRLLLADGRQLVVRSERRSR